jgi:hypothetical protein
MKKSDFDRLPHLVIFEKSAKKKVEKSKKVSSDYLLKSSRFFAKNAIFDVFFRILRSDLVKKAIVFLKVQKNTKNSEKEHRLVNVFFKKIGKK